MKKVFPLIVFSALAASTFLFVLAHGKSPSQEQSPQVEVRQPIHYDVSPPLRDIQSPARSNVRREEKRLRLTPSQLASSQEDPALQGTVGPLVGTTAGLNFAGVGNGDYGFAPNAAPPDTNASVLYEITYSTEADLLPRDLEERQRLVLRGTRVLER